MSEEIGSLRVNLGTNVAAFKNELVEGQRGIASFAKAVSDQLKGLEDTIKKIGVGLTVGITAPFAAMSVVSAKGAGGFEAAMNKVQAAIRGIDPKQLAEMSKQARELGPAVGRNAIEAAQGIETLALAGMGASTILKGGLASTLKLAGANAANLDSAASALTDVMAQFGKTSGDLPGIVDKITGALDSSKLGFDDFQLAISQAGGVAGAAGVTFEDFNTALAGTSTLFASGSDAGTSFKTFITSLTPKSKEAAGVMDQLGISFFDLATGKMKPLAEQAEILREKLGNLSNKSQTEALTKMFGTDAMRTAIGLMKLGKTGFEELQATIGKASAGDKLAIQMQGYEAATSKLSAAFLNLKIAIGETGLLSLFTSFTQAITGFVSGIASLPPLLLKVGVGLWALGAAIGPLGIALVSVAKIGLVLFVARLGVAGTILTALINPIGFVAVQFVRLATAMTGAGSALTLFATGLARALGPIGLAITALTVLYFVMSRQTEASDDVKAATEATSKAMAAYEEAAMAAAVATGKAREEAMKLAAMKRQEALNSLNAAKASLADAKAKMVQARAAAMSFQLTAGGPGAVNTQIMGRSQEAAQAAANAKAFETAALSAEKQLKAADSVIAAAGAAGAGTTNMDFGGGDSSGKRGGANGPTAAELADRREELKLRQMLDVASARGDLDEQKRVQDLIDLKQREKEYDDAGLDADAARVAAARDMRDLAAAKAVANQRARDEMEEETDLTIAQSSEDWIQAERLERQRELREGITKWQRAGLNLTQAEASAAEDLLQLEAARTTLRQKNAEADERSRQIELARARGDSEGAIRGLEREDAIQRRARDLAEQRKWTPEKALEVATQEINEADRARMQGTFRDTIKGGFRAALEGDFGSWFQGWWKDRVSKAMEDVLNDFADRLLALLEKAGKGDGGSGGGLLSSIGSLFKGGGGGGSGDIAAGAGATHEATHGFATGGSFEVGGRSGIDKNLIQFRATKGEMVNIRKGGGNDDNDNGKQITFDMRGAVVTQDLLDQMEAIASSRSVEVVGRFARAQANAARQRI